MPLMLSTAISLTPPPSVTISRPFDLEMSTSAPMAAATGVRTAATFVAPVAFIA